MYYHEQQREVEIKGHYDCIVVGSGPSGMAAAVSAARRGISVLLIEAAGTVGGVSTTGLMSHFTGSVNSRFYDELLDRAAEKNDFHPGERTIFIDPEMLKITYYELLREAGVELLLYTFVCDVMKEENRVIGVICESKSGRTAYGAKIVIDASGDGDAAYKSGAQFTLGREDGAMQPATLMFKVGGVDDARAVYPGSFESKVQTGKGELQALAKEKLPYPAGHVLLYPSTLPGIATCNMTNAIDIDGTRAEDLTRAEMECRRQMRPITAFLREYVPGYEQCYIISAASLIGIRETRHFKGLATITERDILQAKVFDDWVVRDAYFNFDVHNLRGAGLDQTGVQQHFSQSKGYTIPFGCLVPEKTDGLLLSGRNISGTHMAHSNFRAMPICMAIGEACGIIAAQSIRLKKEPRNLEREDIRKIQQMLS